jgi:MerC mercury resistance protein
MRCCNLKRNVSLSHLYKESTVFERAFSENQLDRWAIGLSGLCLAHCLLSAVLLTVLASAGSVLLHPAFHEVGLLLAMSFAAFALGLGWFARVGPDGRCFDLAA